MVETLKSRSHNKEVYYGRRVKFLPDLKNFFGGNVLWVEMPSGCDSIDIFNRALEHNIAITPGILFSATRGFRNHLRINCGAPWNEANENALKTLGQIVCKCRNA